MLLSNNVFSIHFSDQPTDRTRRRRTDPSVDNFYDCPYSSTVYRSDVSLVSELHKIMEDTQKDRPMIAARERGRRWELHIGFSHGNKLHCKKHINLFFFLSFLGPGPGRYLLPTGVGHRGPDPTKKLMPAYSFGKRLNSSESLKLVANFC